jgi:hypothetical protein
MYARSRLLRSFRLALLVLSSLSVLFLGGIGRTSSAEVPQPSIPEGIGPLPDFSKGAKSGVFVTREHIDKYRALFPRELAELISSNEFVCEVALNPQRPELFEQIPGNQAEPPAITVDGSLSPVPQKVTGPIFPTISEATEENNRTRRAYEVLWNAHSALWSLRSSAHNLMLTIFKEPRSEGHKVEFLAERVYPQSLGVKPGRLESLFREKISATAPQIISPLKWLTLRFVGDVEDYVWVSSPITSKTRQLTGSNRSDLLFSGAFAPDELFVWSGKAEYVEPTSLSLVSMLVPVLETPMGDASVRSESCQKLDFGGGPLALNAQTQRFRNGPGWVPTNVRFVVRSVWRIELIARDPFSLDARQTLYVDALTYQPIYRSVWEHDGRPRRFALGVLGSTIGSGTYRPTWAGQILFATADGGRSVLVPTSVETCDALVPGRTLDDFDPSKIAPASTAEKTAQKAQATAAVPQEIHESGE